MSTGWLIEVESREACNLLYDEPGRSAASVQLYRVANPDKYRAECEVKRLVGAVGEGIRIRTVAELSEREIEALVIAGVTIARA
jgi:hypothetical protein